MMASGRSLPSYGAVQEYRDDPNYKDYSDKPGFEEQLSAITRNISAINNGANTLEKAARVIGTERDNGQASDKIHQISVDTNKTVNSTTKLLRQFGQGNVNRTQRLQIDKLTKDFQESVQRFQTLQKKAAEKAKTVNRQEKAKPKTNWMDDDDHAPLVSENVRRQELLAQEQVIEDDLALIREREDQIRALEGDILDVNEIFRDLGAMIHEQGEQIDTIEANVERAATHVEEGREQLTKAATYQKKSRKKLCCIVMIFVIIAAIIAIILAVTLKK
ncbi:syntaxin-7-like isoform X3 [Dreissena polymorpha]|uniref:t-SNARE coiled-coil homology domain-containing protein n=1 Tax=Dreissena polymorpha TaxID=45954 RepID=A0A9D4MV06_DREPO|nr:syntaxin-7-like isoform X1 [Dreissena polymorpha]XP_052212033.1 syntaxin-7-like isoform X2 [Dreissena polymorpha]XP_052212041.1 syntaxin-7-like isoform X3 [Dreissena polymorpha]XP_052212048.1 syntaxin-7-like isoform X1 [Dreissena polymorpha]XP_052212056.1 syntaxin-7-like isoform X1 [Dreissena polymorpha]XP_052212063.1 syntaxin-7-like isoform X1 [Dreissena polymorpha]XP_052212069.1 syntaxin-7-like isoform X2 [Dreissena polymorpha]XP_052212075.1 syntaxin-7-like isoform X1 [Dreissena polymor